MAIPAVLMHRMQPSIDGGVDPVVLCAGAEDVGHQMFKQLIVLRHARQGQSNLATHVCHCSVRDQLNTG